MSLTAHEVRAIYARRHEIEEVIKALKGQLRLEACQAGYKRSSQRQSQAREGVQAHHIALCLAAYLILERERLDRGITLHQLRRILILKRQKVALPSLQRVQMAA